MHDEDYETNAQPDWDAATHVLTEPFEDTPAVPLSAETQAEIIARVLVRRRAAANRENRPGAAVVRLRRVGLLVAGLAAAAAAIVVLREPVDIGPLSLDATMTRALVRGHAPSDVGERPVLDLRNEPGWIVRLRPGEASKQLQLHVVAFMAHSPAKVLTVQSERSDDAFRVLGEVGALGLQPGDATLYFVVGPDRTDSEVLALAEALHAGTPLDRGWAARRLEIRVVDGS